MPVLLSIPNGIAYCIEMMETPQTPCMHVQTTHRELPHSQPNILQHYRQLRNKCTPRHKLSIWTCTGLYTYTCINTRQPLTAWVCPEALQKSYALHQCLLVWYGQSKYSKPAASAYNVLRALEICRALNLRFQHCALVPSASGRLHCNHWISWNHTGLFWLKTSQARKLLLHICNNGSASPSAQCR